MAMMFQKELLDDVILLVIRGLPVDGKLRTYSALGSKGSSLAYDQIMREWKTDLEKAKLARAPAPVI